ncbi:MAG: flagellar motor protein MotB [Fimbriimonadaceae bacterium]
MASDGTPIIIKKKKAHGHAHHGGSWKVAYADFVTAMMAFFMVMWILGLSDEAKAEISGYFNDPFGYSKTAPLSRNIVKFPGAPVTSGRVKKQRADIEHNDKKAIIMIGDKIEKALGMGAKKDEKGQKVHPQPRSLSDLIEHIEIEVTPEGLRIELKEDKGSVFFETGSAALKPEAVQIIKTLAGVLGKVGRTMYIEGHTDARPYGSGASYDNWDLSQDRANTMRRALMGGGVKERYFLGVNGFASRRLKVPTDPLNPANRRVSILLPVSDEDSIRPAAPSLGPDYVELKDDIKITRNRAVLKPGENESDHKSLTDPIEN